MIVYVYGKCSTCKDALQFLKNCGIVFKEQEITKNPPSIEELHLMLGYQNNILKKLFNTSGLLYKEMQLKEKIQNLTVEQALLLFHQHGMLVKRPFLLGNDFGFLGFKETEWLKKIK
ncbi:MAG: Spx/MgsR family RNA polymerase-binding regulatory protein [Parachlamydiaceae bacterium]|nr:Spx/MgsR family RNA polymerase-binding regulatory protein [Parachlamydiaceae bacterium]